MSKTMEVRKAVKELVVTIGLDNILNHHVTEIAERLGVGVCSVQHAINYFTYSPQAAKYRQ